MSIETQQAAGHDEPSPAVFAEAAAWIARLHGPNRTLQVERGLRRWLDADVQHAAAFEAMTAAWEVSGRLPQPPFPRLSRWERAGYREGFIRSVVAVVAVAVLAVGVLIYMQATAGVVTRVGEQRQMVLDDGSRVVLNTATRVVVKYDDRVRRVVLEAGEALFDVAKQPDRPFIVESDGREVRAVGTSFIVREDEHRFSVTLVEGTVTISEPAKAEAVTLTAGQRFTRVASQPPRVDQPAIEKVTAWRRGLVDFENTPMAEAAAEMNRYSEVKLVVASADAAAIPITGVFRAGDASSFAAAVARAYRLQMTQGEDEIRLTSTQIN